MVNLFLPLFLICSWLINAAPVFNFPLTFELWAISLGLLLIGTKSSNEPLGPPHVPKQMASFCLAVLLVLALTAIRAGLAFFAGGAWKQTCRQMLGSIQRLECVFQAGIDQDYAFRSLSYAVAAVVVFLGAYLITIRGRGRTIPAALAATATLFSLVSAMCLFLKIYHPLPGYVVANEYTDRMTFLMQNPTWVWPYLLPGSLCLFYFAETSRRRGKTLLFASLLILNAFVSLKTQQRGVLVMYLVLGMAWLVCKFTLAGESRLIKKGRRFLKARNFVVISVVVGASAIFIRFFRDFATFLASSGFGERFGRMDLSSGGRQQIWGTAFRGILDHPFFGSGYGSWYSEYGKLALSNHAPLLDTAHNYFVQSIFELGILQTSIHIGLLVLGILLAIKFSRDKLLQRRQILYALAGYSIVLAVQEIDFVRSALYTHALYWGWLLGAGPGSLATLGPAEGSANHPRLFSRKIGQRVLVACSALLFLLGLLCLNWFSLAGFQYEANVHSGYGPKVRWLRSRGTASFIYPKIARENGYALYEIGSAAAHSYFYSPHDSNAIQHVPLFAEGKNYLPIAARGLFSFPDIIQFDDAKPDFGREVSAMLFWPPKITRLPLTWNSGLEIDDSDVKNPHFTAFGCVAECQLKLAACSLPMDRRMLSIKARQNIWRPEEALNFEVQIINDLHPLDQLQNRSLIFTADTPSYLLPVQSGDTVYIKMERPSALVDSSSKESRGILLEKADCAP